MKTKPEQTWFDSHLIVIGPDKKTSDKIREKIIEQVRQTERKNPAARKS